MPIFSDIDNIRADNTIIPCISDKAAILGGERYLSAGMGFVKAITINKYLSELFPY